MVLYWIIVWLYMVVSVSDSVKWTTQRKPLFPGNYLISLSSFYMENVTSRGLRLRSPKGSHQCGHGSRQACADFLPSVALGKLRYVMGLSWACLLRCLFTCLVIFLLCLKNPDLSEYFPHHVNHVVVDSWLTVSLFQHQSCSLLRVILGMSSYSWG